MPLKGCPEYATINVISRMLMLVLQSSLFVIPWTDACQAPLSMGLSMDNSFILQEYWTGLPCPSPGDLPPVRDGTWVSFVFCIVGGFFTPEPLGRPN